MSYNLVFAPRALKHLAEWRRAGQPATLSKIEALLQELREHPRTGTGQVERLRHQLSGYWSRRIDKENRIIYEINDDVVEVDVVSLHGHYAD